MCFQWANDKLKKLTCFDHAVGKIGVIAFALMLAKLWPDVLSLDWYWFGLVFAITFAYLIVKIFKSGT